MNSIHYDMAIVPEDLTQIHWAMVGKMACFYYDACIAVNDYKAWEIPLTKLLGYLCQGDLPRFLVNVHRLISAKKKMATPKDSLALRELYRIRNILAEPMAKALSLQDADACVEHVYAAFEKVEDKWHITLQQTDVLALYAWFATYQENKSYCTLKLPKATNHTLGLSLPKLHADQLKNPKQVLLLVDKILNESLDVFQQKLDMTSLKRRCFVCLYEQEKTDCLSSQLYRLYDRQKNNIIDMTGKQLDYNSHNRFRVFTKMRPVSLSHKEAASNEIFDISEENDGLEIPEADNSKGIIPCFVQQNSAASQGVMIQMSERNVRSSNEEDILLHNGSAKQITMT